MKNYANGDWIRIRHPSTKFCFFFFLLVLLLFFSHDVEWQKCGQVDQTIINMSVRN